MVKTWTQLGPSHSELVSNELLKLDGDKKSKVQVKNNLSGSVVLVVPDNQSND